MATSKQFIECSLKTSVLVFVISELLALAIAKGFSREFTLSLFLQVFGGGLAIWFLHATLQAAIAISLKNSNHFYVPSFLVVFNVAIIFLAFIVSAITSHDSEMSVVIKNAKRIFLAYSLPSFPAQVMYLYCLHKKA